jgi:hypothetical protein
MSGAVTLLALHTFMTRTGRTLHLQSCYLQTHISSPKVTHFDTAPPCNLLEIALYCTGVIRNSKSETTLLLYFSYIELKSTNSLMANIKHHENLYNVDSLYYI